MKLRAIELTNIRRFAGRSARLSGIGDGITVLCQPNEFGKSTFFDALSLDYDAAVLSDCTSSVTPAVQAANLADMQRVGGQVLTAEELEQLLGQQAE